MTRRHGPLVKGNKCIRRRWEEDEAKKSGKRNRSNINRKVGVPVIPFWSNILAGALHNDVFFSCITNGENISSALSLHFLLAFYPVLYVRAFPLAVGLALVLYIYYSALHPLGN